MILDRAQVRAASLNAAAEVAEMFGGRVSFAGLLRTYRDTRRAAIHYRRSVRELERAPWSPGREAKALAFHAAVALGQAIALRRLVLLKRANARRHPARRVLH